MSLSALSVRSNINGRTHSAGGVVLLSSRLLVVRDRASSEIDHNTLSKYDIRKDWRFIAPTRVDGSPTCNTFAQSASTSPWRFHEFKDREASRNRRSPLASVSGKRDFVRIIKDINFVRYSDSGKSAPRTGYTSPNYAFADQPA